MKFDDIPPWEGDSIWITLLISYLRISWRYEEIGSWLKKVSSYQYIISHYGDKMILPLYTEMRAYQWAWSTFVHLVHNIMQHSMKLLKDQFDLLMTDSKLHILTTYYQFYIQKLCIRVHFSSFDSVHAYSTECLFCESFIVIAISFKIKSYFLPWTSS